MAIWAIWIWSSWARLSFFALVGPFFLYRTHILSWPTLDVTNMQVMFVISWLLVTIERATSFGVTNLRGYSPWPRTRRDKSSITHWSPFRVFHLQMWVLYGHLSHFGALEGSFVGVRTGHEKNVSSPWRGQFEFRWCCHHPGRGGVGREGGFAVALQAVLCKVEVSIGPNAKQQGVSELIHSENLLVGMDKVYYLILQVVSFGFDVWTFMCA